MAESSPTETLHRLALLWSHKDPALELLNYFKSFIIVCIYDYFVTLMDLLLFDFVFSYARMYI